MNGNTDDLRYPIGPYTPPDTPTAAAVAGWIDDLERLPADARRLVEALEPAQLEVPYRPGGWTVRQVIHHLADSQLNGYVRIKWALTEERPTIRTYAEERWAELADGGAAHLPLSLALLDALIARWCVLLRALGAEDLAREFVHPESGPMSVAQSIGLYAWHGRHHLAHVLALARREAWELGIDPPIRT